MELKFRLSEQDFLPVLVYSAARSELQRRQRDRNRIVCALVLGLFAVMLVFMHSAVLASIYAGQAILCYLFYPRYARWRSTRYFRKFIAEHYSEKMGEETTLKLGETGILESDAETALEVKFIGISELIELDKHYLIRLQLASYLILPKEQLAVQEVNTFMQKVASRTGLEIADHRGLKWA